MFKEVKHQFEINGVKCSFSSGKVARKSQSAVLAQMGDTVVLATVNVGQAQSEAEFFPLTVEYLESMYAAGRISGSRFRKRDGFPSPDAILNARIIDRTFRPRFPEDYRNEVQVIVKVLSYNEDQDPLIVATNAVSAALMISGAPANEPTSLVRVGLDENGKSVVLNKAVSRDDSMDGLVKMNLVLGGDGETVVNIDGAIADFSEEVVYESMQFGLDAMKDWLEAIKTFAEKVGTKSYDYTSFAMPETLVEELTHKFGERVQEYLDLSNFEKDNFVNDELATAFEGRYSKRVIGEAWWNVVKKYVRKQVMEQDKRIGKRGLDEIRERDYELDVLPMTHGSSLFTRGMTQVLSVTTLGSLRHQQMIDDMTGSEERRFMHHYVDSPYVYSNPIGRVHYMPSRRAIGHSALAEKAFYPVLPSEEEFPYTIICTSEIMEEHGSSSMASSTAPTMSMMAAGVPLKKHVAGIAIGLIYNEDHSEYKLLTDMGEGEDFYGFMDFKVAGTEEGITAIQMDTKTPGLPMEIVKGALEKAKAARMTLLQEMKKVIAQPRPAVSDKAPKVKVIHIPVDKIADLIGPGGKVIKGITEDSGGAELNVEQDGTVHIFAQDEEVLQKALKMVDDAVFIPEVGKVYEGKVVKIMDFGAFVDIAKNVSGLVHVSEMSDEYVKDVRNFVKEGDTVMVKLLSIDDEGKLKLSMKAVKKDATEQAKE